MTVLLFKEELNKRIYLTFRNAPWLSSATLFIITFYTIIRQLQDKMKSDRIKKVLILAIVWWVTEN